MNTNSQTAVGYLPDERPTFIKLLLYAIQQVIVMFPATVTVALITGFQVSTTIFASGLATVCFILITGRKIPMYYGSSFAYLTAISSMVAAEGTAEQLASFEATGILPTELISYAQFGIILSGLVSIAAGLLVRFCGHKAVVRILPASGAHRAFQRAGIYFTVSRLARAVYERYRQYDEFDSSCDLRIVK